MDVAKTYLYTTNACLYKRTELDDVRTTTLCWGRGQKGVGKGRWWWSLDKTREVAKEPGEAMTKTHD